MIQERIQGGFGCQTHLPPPAGKNFILIGVFTENVRKPPLGKVNCNNEIKGHEKGNLVYICEKQVESTSWAQKNVFLFAILSKLGFI